MSHVENSSKMPRWMQFYWTFSPSLLAALFCVGSFGASLYASSEGIKTFVDPAGFFSVSIPNKFFKCHVSTGQLSCQGLQETSASLSLKVSNVPKEAHINNVALLQLEEFEKKTRFRQLTKVRTAIDSKPALRQSFTFDALGSIARPTWVQFTSVIDKGKLAVLEITCASQDCVEYEPVFKQIEQNLRMAPIRDDGKPDKKRLVVSDGYVPVTILKQIE